MGNQAARLSPGSQQSCGHGGCGAGWSQAEVADKLGYSGSHVSSVETMTRLPVADFTQRCDEIFGTPGTFARLQEDITKEAYPPWFSAFVHFEAKATRIHCWDNRCLTGLIQTEEHARSIIRAGNLDASDDEVARDVAARIERQRIMQQASAPYCWFIVHESALRTTFGGKAVMRGQMDMLLDVMLSPRVVVQVFPLVSLIVPVWTALSLSLTSRASRLLGMRRATGLAAPSKHPPKSLTW
jgi:transcriptional regulator with XRE-family HTH domain